MKQSSPFLSSQDHAKPFVMAIGIAFTFLALVVLYIAFSKGGFDIRSRAAAGSCSNIVPNPSGSHCNEVNCSLMKNASTCGSRTDDLGKKCCRWSLVIPTAKPTSKPTPTSMNRPVTPIPTKKFTATPTKKPQRVINTPLPTRKPTPTPKAH